MEEESIIDADNIPADTFSHTSSSQRENANTIFTSEKLEKPDELVDVVKKLKINNAKYYESNTATVSDAQGNLTINPETVTHSSNSIFENKFSCRTIHVLFPPRNPGVAAIRLVPPTLLMPVVN